MSTIAAPAEPIFTNKTNGSTMLGARPLEDRHVRRARLVASRQQMLDHFPKGGVVAELGVAQGRFASEILTRMRPREYHGLDIRLAHLRRDLYPAIAAPHVHFQEGDSSTLLSRFPDASFDMIYIDGDHTYQGARADAMVALAKIKPDGLLVFNDYTSYSPLEQCEYGVMRVVHEVCLDFGYEFAFLALQSVGYHDVALRRIA